MSKKTIYFKSSNTLINKIRNKSEIITLKKPSFLSKLLNKKYEADIYFHSGALDDEAMNWIKNSKFTITNSFSNLNSILSKTKISQDKIKVIYPSINIELKNIEELKNDYVSRFNLTPNTKLILFYAKNFKNSGIKEFLDITSNLSFIDFKLIILGSKQQLNALDFTLTKYKKLDDKIIKLDENNEIIEDIFQISDIYLLPTYNKNIASNVLKAMFCSCVVFSTVNNDIKEIIDVYATMEHPSDPSTPFKLDAILFDENELNNIKEQNKKIAMEMSLDKNIEKFNEILDKI